MSTVPELDWLSDGIAEVRADGEVVPRNAPMRRWFPEAVPPGSAKVADLMATSQLELLESGHTVEIVREGSRLAVCLHAAGSPRWLIGKDITAAARVDAIAQASDRVRLLGSISGSVVHELANRMGIVLGQAEQLGDKLPTASAEQLEDMVTRARDMVMLLGSLTRMLEWGPREAVTVPVHGIARDAVELVRKYGTREGRTIEWEEPPTQRRPRVHVRAVDAMQSVSMAILFALKSGREMVRVQVDRDRIGHRSAAVIRIVDNGQVDSYRDLARGLIESAPSNAWARMLDGAIHGEELLRAAFRLRSLGGDMRVVLPASGERREIQLLWPEVTR